MMIDKSENDIREIVDDWADAYFKGEIYGFGLSDYINLPTFFNEDMRAYNLAGKDTPLRKFGFGIDVRMSDCLPERGFRLKAVFDNNLSIVNTACRNYEMLSPSEIPKMGKIKIAVFPREYYPIKIQLEHYGLKEFEDFMPYNFFVEFYNYFFQNKVVLWKQTVCITTRCTLKCRDCNMFIPFYRNRADIPCEALASDLDALFGRIDCIQWLGVLGGEPLIHKEFYRYLQKIGEYSNRVGEIVISANGSVIPDNDILECAKNIGNIRFEINNYNISAEYNEKRNKLIEALKYVGISYTLRGYEWKRFRRDQPLDSCELRAHYIRCHQHFPAFQNKRFYRCHLPWSAAQCGLGPDDPQDYLDFTDPAVTDLDIVKAGLGHLPRGYTSNCPMCNGCDPEYFEKIPKAVQL